MTKAILMSIRPQHAVNILNGNKTLELRKTVPKGFNGWVYVYVTKAKPHIRELADNYFTECTEVDVYKLNGKVVARFWFDEYDAYYFNGYQHDYRLLTSDGKIFRNATIPKEKVCLTCVSINDYGKGKMLYTWHIKRLEIFDGSMELSDFYKRIDGLDEDGGYILASSNESVTIPQLRKKYLVQRPPQSWQYVYTKEQDDE